MKNNKKLIWGMIALVLVAALLWGAYALFMPKGTAGAKHIACLLYTSRCV